MARERFGDPEYYTRPEPYVSDAGAIPVEEESLAPMPSGYTPEDLAIAPEPSGVLPDIAFESEVEPAEEEEREAGAPAFTMSKQPETTLATDADKADTGWWENTGAGFLNRTGSLLEDLGTFGEKLHSAMPDAAGYLPIAALSKGLAAAATNKGIELKQNNPYQVRGDWETVEDAWSKVANSEEVEKLDILDAAIQTGEFILETGIVSLPDMFAMVAAMPPYLAARVEELATDRAANNNRDVPNAEDYAAGAATATVVTAIDKMSLGFATKSVKELLSQGIKPALKRIGQAIGVESVQEATQESLEYAGTNVGTEAGATGEEAGRRAMAGAVAGGPFGGAVRTGTEIVSAVRGPSASTVEGEGDTPPDAPVPSDDDYAPTAEEAELTEGDIIAPPPEPMDGAPTPQAPEPMAEAPVPVAETPVATEEAPAAPEPELTPAEKFAQDITKAWAGLGLKRPQREFVVKHGIMPEDVEATGSAGSYTLGDLQRAFNARKSVETDDELAKVLKDAGLKEAGEAISTEGDGSTGGASTGAATPAATAPEGSGAAAVEETAAEPAPLTLDSYTYTPGTKKAAAAAGLTAEELAEAPRNPQGNITKATVEQIVREKNRVDRGDVSKETNDVLNYVEDNFPAGNYDTEKTGRTRKGTLSDKVSAVSSLVTLVDRLRKNSTAPDEVLTRAGELATDFARIGKVSDAQEQGKGFTSTIKAGVLDPLLDELSELAVALDQNRAAKKGTLGKVKLAEVATKVEEKVAEKTGKPTVTTSTIAEQKVKLANRREKLRGLGQKARRLKGVENRNVALSRIAEEEAKLASEEANFSKVAGATEKQKPKTEKRAKSGAKVSSGKNEVVAKRFTNAGEARNVMNKMGVPESVTGVTGKVSDLPIDINHYSLFAGLYKKLRGAETDAVKSKDAGAEQRAKGEQRKLANITKNIITTPDELAEGAHTKAAGDLAKMGLPKSVIDDVIDFAEAARVVTQRESQRAEDTTEEIREIAAEEDFAETGQEVDLEEQVAGIRDAEVDLQSEYDTAVDLGNFELAEKLLRQMGNEEGADIIREEKMIYSEDTDSDTVMLSDEYDPNEATGAQEGFYDGDEFVDMYGAPGYFGGTVAAPPGHDIRREGSARALARVLDAVSPKATEWTRKFTQRAKRKQQKLAQAILDKYDFVNNQGVPIDGTEMLEMVFEAMPAFHPYKLLSKIMLDLAPNVDVVFKPTGEAVGRPNGWHDMRPTLNGGKAQIVLDPIKFLKSPVTGIQVMMHEYVHHYTMMNTRMDNEAALYIDQLRIATLEAVDDLGIYGSPTDTTKKLNGGAIYGLSNVDEFIAEAFSNPEFQYLLMSLEAPRNSQFAGKRSGRPKSLWDAFIAAVKRIVGLPQVPNSVFEEVVAHSDNVFYNAEETYAGETLTEADRIQTHWADRSMEAGDGKVWRSSKIAGEPTVVEQWQLDQARTVEAARESLGGERGADWGRDAHQTMQGSDPETNGELRDGSPEAVESAVRRFMRETGTDAPISKIREWMGAMSLGLQTMDQIERNHGSKFGSKLKNYMDILRNRNRVAQRWQNRGAAIDEEWAKVEKAGNAKRYSQFVQDTTMSELHPDFSWEKQKHLFSKNEQVVKKAQHDKLSAEFKRLSAAEKKLFVDMRKFFTAQRKELSSTALRHATRVYVKDPVLADQLYEGIKKHGSVAAARAADPGIESMAANMSKAALETFDRIVAASKLRGAYFPLRRYGDWVVEYTREKDLGTFDTKKEAAAATREWQKEHPSNKAKKPAKTDDGKYHAKVEENGVEFFESTAEGQNYIRELKADGWTTKTNPTAKEDWGGRFDVGALQVLQQATRKFEGDATASKAEKARNESLKAALETAFIELLAETSIRKSTLQRKNVRGASLDGRRVFAERVFAGSYALADAENSFDQTQALKDIWSVARAGGRDAYKQGQVARELTLRERHTVNDRRSNAFNDWVGSLGFLGFLAGPSYPVINATQPYMVGLPWLGARYGVKATGALFNNAAKLGPAVLKELIDSGMGMKRNPHQAVQNAINAIAKQGGGGADMLRAMRDAGLMDSTFIDAVSEAAKASGFTPSSNPIFKLAASAPKVVEVMNRTVMGATAYQLEMQKSGNKGKAIEVAKEAILQTQFDYSDFNKPRFFKQPVARPFLLFKMYPQGIYGLMAAAVRQMSTGSKEEQRIGRNTMLGLAASHTVMGGALGGIFMEPVRMLLSVIEMLWPGDEDDKENMPFWDKQQFDINMRQIAADVLGDDHAAELLMRGIPRQFGLDLSGRLGLHNLMFMGMTDDGSGKNAVHKTIDQIGGAPMAVMTSWERAYQFMLKGDYKRAAEAAAPKALRDIMNAHRAGTTGLETFSGTRYMHPSEFEPMDHFIKMLGFSPAKTAELMEERWAQMSYAKKMEVRRSLWLDRLHNGSVTFGEVNKQWNAKHPDYRISWGDKLRKRSAQMKDEMLTSKGYPLDLRKPSIRKQARF